MTTTTELEHALAGALRRHAHDVSSETIARLTQIDYKPRSRRIRRPIAFGALAATAGTAATVISIVGLGAGTSTAFAGWTPTPTPASGNDTAAAIAQCKSGLKSPPGPPSGPKPPSMTNLQLVLRDTRGPFTFIILAGANATLSCVTGPQFASISGSAGSGVNTVPAGKVMLTVDHRTTRDGRAYSLAEGHVGRDVTGATLELSDGSRVTASISNGWFAAWWPGSSSATAALVTTPSGTTRQPTETPPNGACGGQRPCIGVGRSVSRVTQGGASGYGSSSSFGR
jgi:hypothetical protein